MILFYAAPGKRSTSRSAVRRVDSPGGDGGELWTVLPGRPGGGGPDRALDPAGPARAADGQQPLQRDPARGAADVLLAAEQAAARAGALRAADPRAAAGRARVLLPADRGRRSAGAAGRLARDLE